ncbi:hypothetical protein [Catenulispora pinisilvae]|uniref:hypothetical protein n=1 Tax=Catenulispora pinisilvae TaxID=2705253 RepID=UPI0018924B26|nr:hypothetical protein [Catenulispora pinisilvae]
MNAEQRAAKRTAFGAVHTMPTREEVRQQPAADKVPGPGTVPQALLTAAGPPVRIAPESCLNFTLPGGGTVLMNVPTALSWQDALFAGSVIGDFLTALAERMKA